MAADSPHSRIPRTGRKLVHVSTDDLVRIEFPNPVQLPVVMHAAMDGVDLIGWANGNRRLIDELLTKHGAILFREFDLASVSEFERLVEAVSGDLLDYKYRSTPRTLVGGRIYTSTEYPADQLIPLHNELSYATSWPMKVWFWCMQPASRGGETPIADSRKILAGIAPDVVDRFTRCGVMYVRNYGEGLDLPWKDVFQTTSRAEVEKMCIEAGLEFEWKTGGRLRTQQICQGIATHPKTGERAWFNQANLFHVSRQKSAVRDLLSAFAEEDLPRNAYYGDGSPIDAATVDHIEDVYREHAVVFTWTRGDVLLLDNMLTAHGRRPFDGQRRVVVGMAEMIHS